MGKRLFREFFETSARWVCVPGFGKIPTLDLSMSATAHNIILINLLMNAKPRLQPAEAVPLMKSVLFSSFGEMPEADSWDLSLIVSLVRKS